MRATTLLKKLICVSKLIVETFAIVETAVIVHVRPSWKKPRCAHCHKRAPGYDHRPNRLWRHMHLGSMVLWLMYSPRRVNCPRCGVHVEKVPWAEPKSRNTKDFEEYVAYLAQLTDKTHVSKLLHIGWHAVGSIIERIVEQKLDASRFENLRSIGVDEFSYRKRHRYITTVVDHDTSRVVWAAEGKSSETLKAFFRLLGPERCEKIKNVTIDMSKAYIKAVEDSLPSAEVTFDRFHVQRLVSEAVDEVRRSIVRALDGTEDAKAIKKTRFVLLKKPKDLSRRERRKLNEVQQTNVRLYRAYLLKETLAHALDYLQPKRAEKALRDWLAWASRSKLEPFVKAARTIRSHFDGVLAYIKTRLTNGLAEGLNNKTRMVARRAFGFHSAKALISMIQLICGGITLDPPLP